MNVKEPTLGFPYKNMCTLHTSVISGNPFFLMHVKDCENQHAYDTVSF